MLGKMERVIDLFVGRDQSDATNFQNYGVGAGQPVGIPIA